MSPRLLPWILGDWHRRPSEQHSESFGFEIDGVAPRSKAIVPAPMPALSVR